MDEPKQFLATDPDLYERWFKRFCTVAQCSSASRTLRTGSAIQAKFQTDALPGVRNETVPLPGSMLYLPQASDCAVA
jgi:hypothetical protein